MAKATRVEQLKESGALDELEALYTTREDALSLLGNVPGIGEAKPPLFGEPSRYWGELIGWLDGAGIEDGVDALMAAAARIHPGSVRLRPHARDVAEGPVHPVAIALHAVRSDHEILALVAAAQALVAERGGRAALDLVVAGSTHLHMSLGGVSARDTDVLVHELQRTVFAFDGARVHREDHTFRDYFMDPLFAEGPDGQRFLLDHVRASTHLDDVSHGIMTQYDDVFWPRGKAGEHTPPTVDLRRNGDVQRVPGGRTLHDAGVRPRDTLSIFPERRAGSVNPFLRAESLTQVKNQILDFAASHPDFQVAANSTDLPTEYVFRFHAPGFAPGSPPRRIDQHEVLLVTPPDFPVKAPQAYWQHDLFHPNVHATNGLVCLGVLADSYRPGIHFGAVCQMLVDMASFRNYALDEGYNPEAMRWALSDDGQAAILAIGGRPREEVLGLLGGAAGAAATTRPQPRRVHLRRVEA